MAKNQVDDEGLVPEVDVEEQPKESKKYKSYDKAKRGTVFIDDFGKRKRRGIDLGLSDMVLPPITRKTIATYRVLQGQVKNPATKDYPDPQPLYLPGSYLFYDKYEPDLGKRQKEIRNFTGKKEMVKQQNGENRMEDVIDMVIFHDGVIKVDVEAQYPLYVFLELYPANKTNKFRRNVKPEFERVDLNTSMSLAFKMAQEELGDEAIIEIKKLTKVDEIIGYAASAGIATHENGKQREIALIKSDLRAYAFSDPKGFFSLSKNTTYAVKMTVLEADSYGIIEYDHDKKKWITPLTDEPLFVVLAGNDPVQSFADFLSDKKNVAMYDAIRNCIDYWEH